MNRTIPEPTDGTDHDDDQQRHSRISRLPAEYRVISEAHAADYCDLSLVHFRRLRREKRGPRYVRLSQRRIGYRFVDVLTWLEERLG